MEANWGAILLAVLGIAGMVFGAMKSKTEAESKERIANAEIKAADADTERKKAEAEIKERSDMLEMIKGLATQNKEQTKQGADFLESLGKIREEKEADYQTLKALSDTNTQIILTEVQKSNTAIIAQINALDTSIQSNKLGWIETVASEFAMVFASKLQEQILLQNQYPFPAANDPDWVEDFIKPLVSHVYIYSRPFAGEETRLQMELRAEGENLELFRGWKKDWVAVRFTRGNKAVFGWIQEHEVRIGVSAVKLATNEVQAMNASIPATTSP